MLKGRRDLVILLVIVAAVVASPALAGEYKIDPNHSSVVFKVNHLGAGNVYGMIPDISGTVSLDPENLELSSVAMTAKPESLSTFNARRDSHLKSVDFFNVKEFPEITFKSTSCKKLTDDTAELKGNFKMLGVTKAVTAQAKFVGRGKNRGGTELVGFEATFKIDRTDFAMNYGVAETGGLGKQVTIIVAIECQKQ